MKHDNARVKFKLNMNGVIEEVADHGMLTQPTTDSLDMQPQEVSEGKLTDIKETNGCEKKDDDIPEGMLVKKKKKSHVKGTLRLFHNIKRAKDKKIRIQS